MVLYKDFKVGELFEPYLPRNKKLDKKERGRYPLICGSGVNNGIDGYTDEDIDVYENELTMSTRGSSGATFYQEGKFVLNNNSMVLKLKEEYPKNKGALIYISTHLNKLPYEGYTNYPTKSGIVKDVLELPVKSLEDTEPDWEYMEEYIKQKELAYIDKLNKEFEQKKEQLIELIGEETEYINIEELPTAKFKIGDLFTVESTKSLDAGKLTFKKEGINFVGRTGANNGVQGKIGRQEFEPNEPNTITASVIGNLKYVKYQQEYYYTSQNINKLTPKYNMGIQHIQYFITHIKKFVEQYNGMQGGYKLKDIREHEIEVLVNPEVSELVPDWNTIEDYVNGITHLYKHKEEESYKEKLELLYELTGWTEEDLDNIGDNN